RQFFHEPRYRPNLIMQSRYEAGVLGRKSKKGFYEYDTEMKPVVAPEPAPPSLCLVTPIGEDATTCAVEQGLDPSRTVAVDTLFPLAKRRTIMGTPVTDPAYREAAHGLHAPDGVPRQLGP